MATASEVLVLRRYIELDLQPPEPADHEVLLAGSNLRGLAALLALLDTRARYDVVRFVRRDLTRLLNHLSRRTEQRRFDRKAQIRGRVDWPATYKARHAQDYDPSLFVCREVRHQFDTPENQLVAYLLHQIGAIVHATPQAMRDGTLIASRATLTTAATYRRLAAIEAVLVRARRNPYLRQVTLPMALTPQHRHRALIVELEEYRAALALHDHLVAQVEQTSREGALAYARVVLRTVVPLPGALTPEAELWLQLVHGVVGEQRSLAASMTFAGSGAKLHS